MKKHNMVGLFLLGILVINMGLGVAVASDEDDDGVDDDLEELSKRDIEIQFDSNEIHLKSTQRTGEREDEIELTIKYDSEGLNIEIGYESEIENESESEIETEIELEFEVTFRKLIEYVDLNDNGVYDESIDQTIQEIVLNSFQPVIYTVLDLSLDTQLHYFIVNTTDGVFVAHIYLAEEFTIVNDTLITPTETKIDIEINNFDYNNVDSQLALYVKLESETDYDEDDHTEDEEEGYAEGEEGVYTSNNGFAGFFTWTDNATIDGVSQNVLASEIQVDDDDDLEQKLYLNYPRGAHIYHDPKIGISALNSPSSLFPSILSISIGSFIGLIAILTIIIAIRRRRIT
ncbi:MAG: hypothetical protein ACFE9T_10550 [Promethearchaeota archaeon]